MKHMSSERGFMKVAIVVVVGFCILFIFFFKFAQYFSVNFASNSTGGTGSTGATGAAGVTGGAYVGTTNPLLDFGELSGNLGSYSGGVNDERIRPNTDGTFTSPYAGAVNLSMGNAASSIQPYEEYVTIENNGSTPVSITGWVLTNGKGSRPAENRQNDYFYPSADVAIIGQGTEYLSPSGRFETGPIILAEDDLAIVTTGGPYSQYAFSIYTSFRENICLGYLKTFPFTPRVTQSCPVLSSDPLIRTVTDECYDYVRSLGRCQDPTDNPTAAVKEKFELQSNQCQSFVRERAGYASCVAQNSGKPGFSTRQWRVFLGQSRQMWASSRETITLYDDAGRIVDQATY